MDPGFPGQHTTTTTVTTNTTTQQRNVRFDPSYTRTIPGILKVVQVGYSVTITKTYHSIHSDMALYKHKNHDHITSDNFSERSLINPAGVLNLLGFICITVSANSNHSRGSWFNTVAMGGFWITGFLLAFYLFHVVEKFNRIPWLRIEFIFCTLWAIFYLLAASLAADYARGSEAFGVAAFFGFCGMIAYGYDAWLKFNGVKSGAPAQGQYESSKQVSTVTSPAY